jgi:hypothetical protein
MAGVGAIWAMIDAGRTATRENERRRTPVVGATVVPTAHRLAITLEFGGVLAGGPMGELVPQLADAGLDATGTEACGSFFGLFPLCPQGEHPTRERAAAVVNLSARYLVSNQWSVGVGTGITDLGGSVGYDGQISTVHSTWRSTTTWAAGYWYPRRWLRVGGGPGWYRLKDGEPSSRDPSRAGLMGELGIEGSSNRRLALDLSLRWHLIPGTDVAYAPSYVATFEPFVTRVGWSHLALHGGIGIRLW